MKQVVATVTSNERLWREYREHGRLKYLGTWLMWLNCPELASKAKPGQFVMVHCGEDCLLLRPFSIHQIKDDNIALFYAVLADGKGTNWLSQRKKDDKVKLPIPYSLGNGFSIRSGSNNLLLVAGGNGIAPLYFLAQEALRKDCSVTLLYGTANKNRYPEHLMPSGIELVAATEDGTVGQKGMITDFLPDFVDRADQIFVCGPTEMYRNMARRKKELKFEGKQVQISLEVRMGCGLGVCYGCTVKTKEGLKQVCKDGPIFDLDSILWDELSY
ncbi:MAG: dihydroorotate dehydrogenase electron transfer subunit [Dehalococcoidia bacterium]|nr:MAG: dihydroorotate dehydrogenase electron transfer subunit [Dehalococcoidia bacterium]